MDLSIGRAVLPVVDQDAALAFYRDVLGCTVLYDDTGADGRRLVHVGFAGQPGVGIWLLRTDPPPPAAGPRLVLYTHDLAAAYAHMGAAGVEMLREPASADGSRYMHIADPDGNEIVVVQVAS